MKIEGNILKVSDGYVFIQQFYSGYIYKAQKEHVQVKGTPEKPEMVNGKPVGRVDGMNNFTLVKAPWISSN